MSNAIAALIYALVEMMDDLTFWKGLFILFVIYAPFEGVAIIIWAIRKHPILPHGGKYHENPETISEISSGGKE